MDKLPKLQRCPKCGREPGWFTGYSSREGYISLWVYCDCNHEKLDLRLDAFGNKKAAEHAMALLTIEWDAYCSIANKETQFFMPKGEKE